MNDKFKCLEVDEETTLLRREAVKVGGFDAMHETWRWEAVTAESLVFVSDEVKHLSRGELEGLAKISPFYEPGSGITLTRGKEFTFVNFNFRD